MSRHSLSPAPTRAAPTAARRVLRRTLGRYPTGVAVVTAAYQDRPVALTINSFTSVSLEPPLVLWCVRQSSSRLPALAGAPHFAINMLARDQGEVAVRCAGRDTLWPEPAHRTGPYGVPVLTGTVGCLVCRRERVTVAGDHLVMFGEILDHYATDGPPLVFLDGRYR